MAGLMAYLPCPHGDAVCSRARREPKRFHDSGLCIDCRIDLAPNLGTEATAPQPVSTVLVARVRGIDVEVSA